MWKCNTCGHEIPGPSAPCSSCTSLRAEVEGLTKQSELQSDVMARRLIRIHELEKAVEWVLDYRAGPSWAGELRRKAGM